MRRHLESQQPTLGRQSVNSPRGRTKRRERLCSANCHRADRLIDRRENKSHLTLNTEFLHSLLCINHSFLKLHYLNFTSCLQLLKTKQWRVSRDRLKEQFNQKCSFYHHLVCSVVAQEAPRKSDEHEGKSSASGFLSLFVLQLNRVQTFS